MSWPATREKLTQMLAAQYRRGDYGNYIALVGKELNLAVKYSKGSMMKCLMPGSYMILVYEPPNLHVPNVKYALQNPPEIKHDYKVVVNKHIKEGAEEESDTEDFQILQIPAILKSSMEETLQAHVNDKKDNIDLTEYPSLVSSRLSTWITKEEIITNKHYGWHIVASGTAIRDSESNSIVSTVDKLPYIPEDLQAKPGLKNILHRDYVVSFVRAPGKKVENTKIHMFRVEKTLESWVKRGCKDCWAGGITQILSIDFIHKILFFVMLLSFFVGRFSCKKYDEVTELDQTGVDLDPTFSESAMW